MDGRAGRKEATAEKREEEGDKYVGTSVRGAPATMCVGVGGPVGRRGKGCKGGLGPESTEGEKPSFHAVEKRGPSFSSPSSYTKAGPHTGRQDGRKKNKTLPPLLLVSLCASPSLSSSLPWDLPTLQEGKRVEGNSRRQVSLAFSLLDSFLAFCPGEK